MTDEALMARVQADDLEALGEIYDRHRPALVAFLWRILRNPADAEDLAQEVFWRVWTRRETYDPRRRFASWLFAVARHAALDHLRRPARETSFSDLLDSERLRIENAPAGGSASAGQDAGALEDRIALDAALESLTADQRMALILKEFHGLSYREIGEALECSEGAARALAHRARGTLRRKLQEPTKSKI